MAISDSTLTDHSESSLANESSNYPNRHPLRQRSFSLFLLGSVVSWIGDWMDLAALNWAVLELSGSPLDLGLINACRLVPVFAFSIPAGILADRSDRRRLLLILQISLMVMTFVVGALVAMQSPFWGLAVAVTLRSSLAAMVLPIRNALLPNLVDRPSLAAAVALQTAGMNVSRIIGPALAGWLLTLYAVEMVFWINGASFVVVIATTWVVRPVFSIVRRSASTVIDDLVEALVYVREHRLVRSLLLLAIVPMVFGFPYTALMPLFARDLYGVGPKGFGLLLSMAAIGALLGATWLSFFSRNNHTGIRLIGSILLFGASLLFCSATDNFFWAAAGMVIVGWSSQSYRTLSRIILQAEVPDHLRGRVLSIALLDRGFIPLGILMLSAIAEMSGTRAVGMVMGVGCIVLPIFVIAIDRRIAKL